MKRKRLVSYSKYGYLFAIPFFVAFLIFTLYPIMYTLLIAFTNQKGIIPPKLKIASDPLDSFKYLFKPRGATGKMSYFLDSLINTAKIWIINFIPQLTLALLLAAWFTDNRVKVKGQGFYKVVFYLPNIITAATIAILFGIFKKAFYFLDNGMASRGIVEFIQCWQWYGSTMITLIAAVIGINPEIFEAAEIDGAGRWRKFWNITLPSVRPIMLFTLVTSMIGGLSMFDIPMLFGEGKQKLGLQTIAIYIYQTALKDPYMYNRAAAASIILFLIIMVISVFLFWLLRDKDAAKLAKMKKQEMKRAKALGRGL